MVEDAPSIFNVVDLPVSTVSYHYNPRGKFYICLITGLPLLMVCTVNCCTPYAYDCTRCNNLEFRTGRNLNIYDPIVLYLNYAVQGSISEFD